MTIGKYLKLLNENREYNLHMITVRIKLDNVYKESSTLREHSYRSNYIICPNCPYGSLLSSSVDFIKCKIGS